MEVALSVCSKSSSVAVKPLVELEATVAKPVYSMAFDASSKVTVCTVELFRASLHNLIQYDSPIWDKLGS